MMEGTTKQRLTRLFKHLISTPEDMLPYITHGPFTKITPVAAELPWFSWGAIRFLDIYSVPGMQVFEWGAGGSTLFFSSRRCRVHSIENNFEWYTQICDRLSSHNNPTARVEYVPWDLEQGGDFESSDYLTVINNMGHIDIIVIDGAEGGLKTRPQCFLRAQEKIQNGIIVVDDSWRYPEITKASYAKKIHRFKGTGPFRPGITSTDIHFYYHN